MTDDQRIMIRGIGKALKKRLDSLRDEFQNRLSANQENDSAQTGLDNLRKEMLMGMITLREDILDEVRRMILATVQTLKPTRKLTIEHSDGTESKVTEGFDGEEGET